MDKKLLHRLTACTLLIAIAISGVGCKKQEKETPKVEKKVEKEEEKKVGELSNRKLDNFEFSLNLLKNTYTFRQNSVIAPMSVQMALAVALNGSSGVTQQCIIENMGMETIKYNEYIDTYYKTLGEEESKNLVYANSIWFNNITGNMGVNSNFQNRVKNQLHTDIELLVFNSYTKDALNSWINDKTNGFIDSLFAITSSADVMYAVNAAAFNMDWEESYSSSNIAPAKFLNMNRTLSNVEMMTSVEKLYIEDNNATGFIKNYNNPRYQFIGLLPDKTTNVYAYMKTLSADSLNKIISKARKEEVQVSMPKFTGVQTLNLRNALSKMGMDQLFSEFAQYTGFMKNGHNIVATKYYHKAKIEIGKTATQAGGVATINEVKVNEAERQVVLNRPFIYMVYDSFQGIPIFIGVQQYM